MHIPGTPNGSIIAQVLSLTCSPGRLPWITGVLPDACLLLKRSLMQRFDILTFENNPRVSVIFAQSIRIEPQLWGLITIVTKW